MVKPSTRGEFAGVKKRCEEALEAGWTEEQVSFVIRHGLVGAWTRDAVQFALTKAREAQNGNGSRSRSAVLNGSPVPLRDAVATLFRVDGNQREIGTGR